MKRAQQSQTEKPIQVFVRVRPLNQIEKNSKSFSVVSVNNGKEVSVKERPMEKTNRNFAFDKVFGPESKQIDVYKKVVYPLIEEVLTGYNCTVFAYGQTGTGKTFTMEGAKSANTDVSWEDDPLSGIIPRSLSHLFDELRIKQLEHTVRVSFLELYNEELFDLLSSPEDTTKLRLFEDSNKKGSVIIQSLEEMPVHNKAEIYKLMEKGSQKRQTAATLMNAQSSRSHTIFSITVHIKETSEKGEELFKIGKLNLVDLAGSENIGRSGAVDKRAREAGNINQSLLTLGRVITSLVEKAPHIPYRESKLTRLLQDSLGGRTKTSIIATVSPALCNLEETLSTLEYASRAKSITNRPEINQKLTKKAFLKEYEEEIDRLKRDLQASRDRNGIYVDAENYTKMNLQIEEQEKEISEYLSKIKALTAEMEKREEIITELKTSNERAKEEIERRKETCRETKKVLKEVTIDRDENKLLKEKHMKTEEELRKQAEQLLSVADVATTDTVKLHEKIERKGRVETNNVSMCNQFCDSLKSYLSEMGTQLGHDAESETKFFNLLKGIISNNTKMQDDCLDQIRSQLKAVCQLLSERMEKYTVVCQSLRKEKHDELTENLNELKRKLDKNNNTLDTTIIEAVIPQLNDAFDHLDDLNEFLAECNKVAGKVNEDVSRLRTETCRLKDFTKQQIETNLTSLKDVETNDDEFDKLDALFLEMTDSRAKDVNEMVSSMKQVISNFEQVISNFEAAQAVREEKYKELMGSRLNAAKKSRSALRNLSSSMRKNIQECEPNFIETISLVNSVDNSLRHQQTETAEKLQSWRKSEEEKLKAVKSDVENLSAVSKESKKIFDGWSADFNKTLQESNVKETQLEEEEKQALLTDVSEEVLHSESFLSEFSESSETAIVEMENIIDDRLINSEKSRTDLTENLELQKNLIGKFLEEDIKMDVPTGITPQKREFNYPHNLVATSPHEAILQRYRETVQYELSLNDSLDETTASEDLAKKSSTESLSTASSLSLNQKENDSNSISPVFKKVTQSALKKRILGQTN